MRKIRVFPLLMALGLCLALVGCKKPAARPSKEYFQARTMWIDLLREKRGKAYAAPEAQEVMDLLRAVDPKSLDAVSAQSLFEEIQAGRSAAKADEAELQAKIEKAQRAGQADPGEVVFANVPHDGGTAELAGGPDAGPKEPVVGMPEKEFTHLFGRCFEFKNDAIVGGVAGGQVWGLRDLMTCRQDFPNFVSNSLVLADGKIGAIKSSAELAPRKFKMVGGKLVPLTAEDEKAGVPPAPPPEPEPRRNPADVTPTGGTNPSDVTPKGGTNPNDVTPKAGPNPSDVTPRY